MVLLRASKELKEVVKGDDKEAIEAKTTALTELSGKLAERAYAQQAGAEGDPDMGGATEQPSAEADDSVVDAEFEEVKDDDKK